MHRRAVLTGAGVAFAGFAGCSGRSADGGPGDGSATPTPVETGPRRLGVGESVAFDDGTSLTVADPAVQASVVADHAEFLTVEREEGLQFVVVDVDGDAAFEPPSFVLSRDGVVEAPPRPQQPVRGVTRRCGGTCIAVPVVVEAVDSAAVVYRRDGEARAAWDLGEALVDSLALVPDLRVRDASFTDRDGDLAIEFTVQNVGERSGGFRALVAPGWAADVEEPVGFVVPRGETVTETVVPREIQRLGPGEAAFEDEPTEETRRFVVEPRS